MLVFLLLAFAALLGACTSLPSIPPNVAHEDAHNGGSALAIAKGSPLVASGGWEGAIRVWALPDGPPGPQGPHNLVDHEG